MEPDKVIEQVGGILRGVFGCGPGGSPGPKTGCDHGYELMGRLSVTGTAGLLSSSYRATVIRCVKCQGYVFGKETEVGKLLETHHAAKEPVKE